MLEPHQHMPAFPLSTGSQRRSTTQHIPNGSGMRATAGTYPMQSSPEPIHPCPAGGPSQLQSNTQSVVDMAAAMAVALQSAGLTNTQGAQRSRKRDPFARGIEWPHFSRMQVTIADRKWYGPVHTFLKKVELPSTAISPP